MVIIQMQRRLIFQLQRTIVLKLLKPISILESIFKNGYRYQKAGVMLTGLRNDDGRKNLFS